MAIPLGFAEHRDIHPKHRSKAAAQARRPPVCGVSGSHSPHSALEQRELPCCRLSDALGFAGERRQRRQRGQTGADAVVQHAGQFGGVAVVGGVGEAIGFQTGLQPLRDQLGPFVQVSVGLADVVLADEAQQRPGAGDGVAGGEQGFAGLRLSGAAVLRGGGVHAAGVE